MTSNGHHNHNYNHNLVAHFLELRTPYFDPVLFTKFHGEHFGRVSFLGPNGEHFDRIFWVLPRFLWVLPRSRDPIAHFLRLKTPYFGLFCSPNFMGNILGQFWVRKLFVRLLALAIK